MQELIEKLILLGFPEECAEEVINNISDIAGERGAEDYVRGVERDLYVERL